MKMDRNGTICPEQIEETVSAAEAFAAQAGLNRNSRLRLRLLVEELLLFYRDVSDEKAAFFLKVKPTRGDLRVVLEADGPARDPIKEATPLLHRILQSYYEAPAWSYENGRNRVTMAVPIYNTTAKNIRLSWKYMAGQRGTFILAVSSQFVSVGLNVLAPLLTARVIVDLEASVFSKLLITATALLSVRALTDFVLFVANRSYNRVYNKTLSNLEEDLVDGALRITNDCIDEKGTGLFIQRLTADTTALATGFNTLADLVAQMFNYVGILAAILFTNVHVFLVVLALLTVQSLLELKRSKQLKKDDRVYRESNERFTGFVGEMVKGSKDVKLLNCEDRFREELTERINDANDKRMFMQGRSWKYRLTRMELGEVGYFVYILLLGLMIARGSMAPVTAIVLFTYYSQLGAPAALLAGQFLEFITNFNLSAERVFALLSSPEFPKERFGSTHLERVKGEIRFQNVSFAYKNPDPKSPPRDVLRNMDLLIPAGMTTALVGRSGAGKTTIFNLICKLYNVSSGSVTLDGVDIRELDRETLRSNIAVVSQNPYIFHLSVRDNLRIVKPYLTNEEMYTVCRMACIHEDICRMPDGYDTIIGEGGTNLSGGQRQRLAIARSLLREFRILLLDEATSALDNITQARIQETLRNVRRDHTVIMIAHRLSTIIDADKIIYLENGRIMDEGRHSALMQRCASYRELYEVESSGQGPGPTQS